MAGSAWPACLQADNAGSGCELFVHVVPNASRTACAGMHGDALRVRLAAPPLEGRANAALLQWLADALALPCRAVRLRAGEASRRKRVHLDCDGALVADWLARQLASAAGPGT